MEFSKKFLLGVSFFFGLGWQHCGILPYVQAKKQLHLEYEMSFSHSVSIVMEDDILFVTSSNSADPIDEVLIYNSNRILIHHSSNCNTIEFILDCSQIGTGTFQVQVSTQSGLHFSDDVVIE